MKILDRIGKFIKDRLTSKPEAIYRGSAERHTGYGSGAKQPGGLSRAPGIVIHDHYSLRQNVRDMFYDSIEARSLARSIVDTTVDTGLKLKPTPMADILGITDERAEEWAKLTAERFHMWAMSKKSHRPEVNNFYQNQSFYELQKQRDNDIFVRLYYSKARDLFNPLQIDFIDPNQIRGTDYTTTYVQGITDDGIIRDDAKRETAYKIWQFDKQGGYTEKIIPRVGEKSGRLMMIHGFNPEYAGQTRGYPKMTHLIQEFADLTDFKASVIQKAINQASAWAAIENEQMDASQPLAGRVAGPVKEYGSFPTPGTDAKNVDAASLEPVVNWEVMPEATIRQPGSMLIGNLKKGDKIKYLMDTSPSHNYDVFVSAFFSSISASMGWSMELVLKKFNNNYSASRATLLLCWRTAQIERDELAADFLNPIYEMWLSEEIAAGHISAPGWNDPLLRAAWLSCDWAGAPLPAIDPLKSMQAGKLAVELGAETLDDVARNYNSSSGKANRAKNKRQYEELGAPPWGGWGQTEASDDDENEKEEDK